VHYKENRQATQQLRKILVFHLNISSSQFAGFVISFTEAKIFQRENCLTFRRITNNNNNNINNNLSYIKEKGSTATNNSKCITEKVRTHTKLGL
jgi:hypothetical protein